MSSNLDTERFRSGVKKYAAFLETFEGRMRLDLTLANVQEFLPQGANSLRVLDLGGGTGAMAIRLARLGHEVTLLDSSQPMLAFAESAAQKAGVRESIRLQHGDAGDLSGVLRGQWFDVILCHNVLEYVEDPGGILNRAAGALRDSASILSILVRNRAGDVLKAAIKEGDLVAAEQSLTREWGYESLYGGDVRLFAPESLQAMVKSASLETVAVRGVRVVSDYLAAKISRENEYQRIFDLEYKLGTRAEFGAVARYTHCIARRAGAALKEDR